MATPVFADHRRLHALAVAALTRVGVSEEHAHMTADVLVAADLRGVDSHGIAHLAEFYVGGIRDRTINADPKIEVVGEAEAAATIDGDSGLGFVVGQTAMNLALRKAARAGVGLVAVRNSTHYGPGFYYAMMALPHDMLGLSMTTGGNIVIPPGG